MTPALGVISLLLALGPGPADADDAVFFALEFRGRELAVIPAHLTGTSAPDPYFDLRSFAAALGITLLPGPHPSGVEGRLPLETPVSFTLDPDLGRASRDGHDVSVEPGDWQRLDGHLFLRAALLTRLTGVALEVRTHALSLVVRSPERAIPTLAAARLRRGPTDPVTDRTATASAWARVPDRRLGDLFPRALHVVHSSTITTTTGAAAGSLRAGTSLLRGGLEVRAAWRRDLTAAGAPADDLRWTWTLGRPGSRWLEHLRIGWGPSPGPGPALERLGITIGNGPLRRPASIGSFTRAGITEPGAEIQLFVAGRMIDAVVADRGGAWSLELPMTAGENRAELVFLRSDGIHREPVLALADPAMIPAGRLEYTVSYERGPAAWTADLRWGLHPRATVQVGARITSPDTATAPTATPAPGFLRWAQLAWAPHDRLALRLEHIGPSSALHLRVRPWTALEVDASHQRTTSASPHPIASAFATHQSLSQLRLRTRSPGPVALGIEVDVIERVQRVRHALRSRLDLRARGWMATVQLEALRDVDAHGRTAGWRSRERVAFVLAGLPAWLQVPTRVRLSTELLSRDRGAHLEGVTARMALPGLAFGQLEASTAWSPGRPLRFALALQTTTPFARITQAAARTTGPMGDRWSGSTSVSGTLAASSGGLTLSPDLASTPATLVVGAWVDDNANGRRDPDEPLLPDAVVELAGQRHRLEAGGAVVHNVPTLVPLRVTVDEALPTWDARGIEVVPVEPAQWISLAPFAEGRLLLPFAPARTLTGQVRDLRRGARAGVAGTVLELESGDGRIRRRAVSVEGGHFDFRGLPPGRYVVRVQAASLAALGARADELEVVVDGPTAGVVIDLVPASPPEAGAGR